jgi:golgi SNAP receptor complex member 1
VPAGAPLFSPPPLPVQKKTHTPHQARRLEAQLETELATLAKAVSACDAASGGGEAALAADARATAAADAAGRSLAALQAATAGLGTILSAGGGAPDAGRAATLARHRDLARDLGAEHRRLAAALASARERAALFGGGSGGGRGGGGASTADDGRAGATGALLRERGVLASANAALDAVLGVASATGAGLASQRRTLVGAGGRLAAVSDRAPVLSGLLGAIRRRRSRDDMVVGGLAALCALLTLTYWFRK